MAVAFQFTWVDTIQLKGHVVTQDSAPNNHQKLVGHLFKIGTLLQTINGFPIGKYVLPNWSYTKMG